MKYKVLQHARMRYDTMSERERFLRVGKMAQLEKLEAFLLVAREKDNRMLMDLCKQRIEQVKSFDNPSVTVSNVGRAVVVDRQREPRREEVKSRSPKARDAKGAEVVVELERDIVL